MADRVHAGLIHRQRKGLDFMRYTMCGQREPEDRVTVVDEDITCPGCLDAMRAANVEDILSGPYLVPFYVLPENLDG